jgi:hypothetical protein
MNQPNGQPMNQPMGQPMQHHPQQSTSKMPWVVLAVVVVIVLAVLGYMFRSQLSGTAKTAKLSGYEAVFLTNGQVYFGKISNPSSDYVTLQDIYYLQVNQTAAQAAQQQGQAAASAAQVASTDQQPQLSLVKLGNELHGPVDSMQINRTQILFFEDLKADGKVSQAIEAYKKNGGATGTGVGGTTAPATGAPATQAPAAK